MEKIEVRDAVVEGEELHVFLSNGDVRKIPLNVVLAAPEMQQSLQFMVGGFRPMLKSTNLPNTLRFAMASTLASADAALTKSERGF